MRGRPTGRAVCTPSVSQTRCIPARPTEIEIAADRATNLFVKAFHGGEGRLVPMRRPLLQLGKTPCPGHRCQTCSHVLKFDDVRHERSTTVAVARRLAGSCGGVLGIASPTAAGSASPSAGANYSAPDLSSPNWGCESTVRGTRSGQCGGPSRLVPPQQSARNVEASFGSPYTLFKSRRRADN